MSASELSVIRKAKDLSEYIFIITDKSPKKYRFTLVSRLQNYSLSIIEDLYRANEVYLKQSTQAEIQRRREYQRRVLVNCRLLDYIAELSARNGAIAMKHYGNIAKLISDISNMTGAWMNSDANRFNKRQKRTKGEN